MTPEQRQAAARVAVHQLNNAKQMLCQGKSAIDAAVGRDKIPQQVGNAFWDAGAAIMTLLDYAAACVDNPPQSDRVKE